MWTENLRSAYRSLRSARGFALSAVLSLGIGIGGSIAMFTLVNSIILRPLAYPEAGQLVLVTNLTPKVSAIPVHGLIPLQFIRWRNEIKSFDSFAMARRAATMNLTGTDHPETLNVLRITPGFFDTLRIAPQRGRWFTESEGKRGAPNIVILTDSLWRRRFSAEPGIIGKKIMLHDDVYEIVGITPPQMRLPRARQLQLTIPMPEQTDAFLPVRFSEEDERGRFSPGHIAIARLKPGVTSEQARAELDSTMSSFPSLNLEEMNTQVGVQPLHTAIVGDVRTSLLMLLCSVALVLLMACANVANLSLVRANQRCRELAIRVALGASKWNLMTFLLTESFLLALGGTLVGWFLSLWIIEVVILWAGQLPRLEETSADVNVFAFAVGICVFTTILFGLLPAWRAGRADPGQPLNAAGRGSTDTLKTGRVRAGPVCTEVALGTVLVIGCGLLLASLHNVITAPRGFEGSDILIADLVLPSPRYQAVDKQVSFLRTARDMVSSIPGVSNVAVNTRVPLRFDDLDAVTREGEETICSPSVGCRMDASNRLPPLASWSSVSSEYFGVMRIPLRAGRLFRDDGESERVALISESAARILWPGDNALGKRLIRPFENLGVHWRVVGIVGDVRSGGLDRAPAITIYRPYGQRGGTVFSLVVRTVIAPEALSQAVRESVARVDAGIPAPEIRTMPHIIARSLQQRQFQASVLAAFALVAVLLAAIGIYGVVAYSVFQRRKEIGVRIALGAESWDIRRIVLKDGMTPVLCGLIVGLMASALSRG